MSLDESVPGGVRKSSGRSDEHIIGIVSTQPAIVLDDAYDPYAGVKVIDKKYEGRVPLAVGLVGRIPVNVSIENGPIKAGDYLTQSSTPGVAMKATKAGKVLGQALFGHDREEIGAVMMFINNSYYNGKSELAGNTIEILDQLLNGRQEILDGGEVSEVSTDVLLAGLTVVSPSVVTQELTVDSIKPVDKDVTLNLGPDGSLIVKDGEGQKTVSIDSKGNAFFAGTLTADKIRANQIEGLEFSIRDQVLSIKDLLNPIPETSQNEIALASPSADILGEQISPSPSVLNLSSLNVEGLATVSGKLRVKEDSLIEGILNVVDTITSQNVIVTNIANFFGDAVFRGNVQFFGAPTFSKDTAGIVIVKKGESTAGVKFEKEYEKAPIINATMLDEGVEENLIQKLLEEGYTFAVSKRTSKGFSIVLNKKVSEDISFSWVAISVKDSGKIEGDSSSSQSYEKLILPDTPYSTEGAESTSPTL